MRNLLRHAGYFVRRPGQFGLLLRIWLVRWFSEWCHASQWCGLPFEKLLKAVLTDRMGRRYWLNAAASEQDLMGALRIYDAWFQPSDAKARLILYYHRFRPFFFVLQADGEVVGYSVYRPCCVGRRCSREAVLLSIALDPDLRGLGLGEALLSTTLDWLAAAGVQEVGLFVEATNPAVRLYEKMGFSTRAHFASLETLWMSCRLSRDNESSNGEHEHQPLRNQFGLSQ